MSERLEYGQRSIDMGFWEKRFEPKFGYLVYNTGNQFKVYFNYPNPRLDARLRYIVSKGNFSIGFASPAIVGDLETGGLLHERPENSNCAAVIIDTIGGIFLADSWFDGEGFPTLATARKFQTVAQQTEFLSVLADAVPRIPALSGYAFRWDGGFGYELKFAKSLVEKIAHREFIEHAQR